jgi:hypothetical protein
LDDKREAAVAIAAIGAGLCKEPAIKHKEISSLPLPEVLPLSTKGEADYPEIWKIHRASYISDLEEAKHWVNCGTRFKRREPLEAEILDSRPLEDTQSPPPKSFQPTLGEVILLRGSSRRFARSPISFRQLSTILEASTTGVPLDFLGDEEGNTTTTTTIDIYMVVNDVEGLPSGGYFFNRPTFSVELLKNKVSRNTSGYLCLGQALFSDASVVFFLMADLITLLRTCGNRGYRASQFEAGIIAGKIYLASYAQQLGASGSTFFDDAVTEFFSPHAKDKSTMIAVGIGIPGYKSRPGKVLAARLSRDQLLSAQTTI